MNIYAWILIIITIINIGYVIGKQGQARDNFSGGNIIGNLIELFLLLKAFNIF